MTKTRYLLQDYSIVILNGDKMKTGIVMIVQIKFVSALDYSFDNYIVELCERLEHSHSPLVDI